MLTARQIDIISYLLGMKEWVTGEELSTHFNLNKKTIQSELKSISDSLGKECNIAASHNKGYHLDFISENARRYIQKEVSRFEENSSLGIRPSSFVLYLLFQKSYVSMQKLADVFYMSKTAVSLEIETVRRWANRYEGIELNVSNAKGIMIHAEEARKRVYCAKFGTINAFRSTPLTDGIIDEYEQYMIAVIEILRKTLIRYDYILTGEEFRKNCRFIASCILRSRRGYPRPMESGSPNDNPMILSIAEMVFEKVGYEFQNDELNDMQIMIEESSVLFNDLISHPDIDQKMNIFEDKIRSLLNLPEITIFTNRDMIAQYISKMYLRFHAGNVAVNHFNQDIFLMYPLETYLAYRLFPDCFQMKISKELSFIALFLATSLNAYRHGLSVLLVSNQNLSIIHQIETILYQSMTVHINQFKALPAYVFEENPEIRFQYDVLLTTDQELLFIDNQFNLINSILSYKDIEDINKFLSKKFNESINDQKKAIRGKYLSEEYISREKGKYEDINQVIGCVQDGLLSYHTIGNEKIYICRISPSVQTQIKIFTLEIPLLYKFKKLKKIVLAQFHEGDAGVLEFFRAVSDIISNL